VIDPLDSRAVLSFAIEASTAGRSATTREA
jgi:hypothetical protein